MQFPRRYLGVLLLLYFQKSLLINYYKGLFHYLLLRLSFPGLLFMERKLLNVISKLGENKLGILSSALLSLLRGALLSQSRSSPLKLSGRVSILFVSDTAT
jgi:hypothetical protein